MSKKYIKLTGKRWTWVIKENNDPNSIHVQTTCTEGYGGRTLTFQLVDGSTLEMVGPWNGNADHLFEDTGYDVREVTP
jgi:hypothetical protein